MMENFHGAKRLAKALRDRMEYPQALMKMSAALYYNPWQLRQDIKTLDELLQRSEKKKKCDE